MKEFFDLLHFAIWDYIAWRIYYDDKVLFLRVSLIPKNTYGNSINAQHVATTDRRAKYIGWIRLYFYLVEFSNGTTQREDIKYGTAAKLARMYHRDLFQPLNANPDDKLADRQWFSSYNSISPEFSLFFDIIQRECNFQ